MFQLLNPKILQNKWENTKGWKKWTLYAIPFAILAIVGIVLYVLPGSPTRDTTKILVNNNRKLVNKELKRLKKEHDVLETKVFEAEEEKEEIKGRIKEDEKVASDYATRVDAAGDNIEELMRIHAELNRRGR